jgi:Flp pilus assembly pilin Flp
MRKLNENGQALAEYGVILALVAACGIAALTLFGSGVLSLWSDFIDRWPV